MSLRPSERHGTLGRLSSPCSRLCAQKPRPGSMPGHGFLTAKEYPARLAQAPRDPAGDCVEDPCWRSGPGGFCRRAFGLDQKGMSSSR